jgi:hypothetical protein
MTKEGDTIFAQPFYYVSFSITDENSVESRFQSLFSNKSGSLKHFLENEAYGFRRGGWGLPKYAQYIIQLNGLEYNNKVSRVKILENGHIIIQAAVSEDFLCWANSNSYSSVKGSRIQINTTALIEFTYNCVVLLKRSLEDTENSRHIVCNFGFIGMTADYVLGDVKMPDIHGYNLSREMKAIGEESEKSINIKSTDVSNADGVAKIAYIILERVFRMFGYSEDLISYVHADGKKIDINLIKGI